MIGWTQSWQKNAASRRAHCTWAERDHNELCLRPLHSHSTAYFVWIMAAANLWQFQIWTNPKTCLCGNAVLSPFFAHITTWFAFLGALLPYPCIVGYQVQPLSGQRGQKVRATGHQDWILKAIARKITTDTEDRWVRHSNWVQQRGPTPNVETQVSRYPPMITTIASMHLIQLNLPSSSSPSP